MLEDWDAAAERDELCAETRYWRNLFEARRREATDPRVWCECFRATLPLSAKNQGATCLYCAEESAGQVAILVEDSR